MTVGLRATVTVTGDGEGDIELALEEVLDSIRRGNTSGFDRNESGSYTFELIEVEPGVRRPLFGGGIIPGTICEHSGNRLHVMDHRASHCLYCHKDLILVAYEDMTED